MLNAIDTGTSVPGATMPSPADSPRSIASESQASRSTFTIKGAWSRRMLRPLQDSRDRHAHQLIAATDDQAGIQRRFEPGTNPSLRLTPQSPASLGAWTRRDAEPSKRPTHPVPPSLSVARPSPPPRALGSTPGHTPASILPPRLELSLHPVQPPLCGVPQLSSTVSRTGVAARPRSLPSDSS